MNDVVLLQGPSNFVPMLKKSWTLPTIYSAWEGEENKYNKDDIVLFNKKPSDPGPANFWMQQSSTIKGLHEAKLRGFENVLKMRSDMIPTSCEKLMSCFKKDAINFLCWHSHEVYPGCPGYLIDFFMYGPIDEMIALWDIQEIFCVVPEIMITWQYIRKLLDVIPVHFILNEINSQNDIAWIKNQISLSSYKTSIGEKHKKYVFNESTSSLNDDYLSFLRR